MAAVGLRELTSVVLRQERTPTDRRSFTARLGPEGDLIIEGQDLGKGIESLSSFREYEWSLTVATADIPKLLAALKDGQGPFGAARGVLRALQRRFSGSKASELEPFLKEQGIPYSFWNRIGD
ncbi:MAG: hypothetical protein KGJ66_02095 [Alphaproteobacteria bacterium]|nr:hypothetical protein [Alphaproteobacteria bacterium]